MKIKFFQILSILTLAISTVTDGHTQSCEMPGEVGVNPVMIVIYLHIILLDLVLNATSPHGVISLVRTTRSLLNFAGLRSTVP